MKKIKRLAIGLLSLCIALSCLCPTAFAEGEGDVTEGAVVEEGKYSGEFISEYVDEVVEYLSVFAKDGVASSSLYKAGLLEALKKDPELYDSVMTAILSSIDDYSVFYPNSEDFSEFLTPLEGTVGGIGITMNEVGGKLVVGSIYNDSPAQRAGILPGDVLYSADGISLFGVSMETAQNLIRGEIGTSVVVGVVREGSESPLFFTITREEIAEKLSVAHTVIEGTDEIDGSPRRAMYIRIYSFMDNASDQFEEAMNEADEKGITEIIIDVRDNGGGYLSEAVSIANRFLKEGDIIVSEDHKVDLYDVVYKSDNKSDKKYDTVVLVNENSASSSEILAAALQDNKAAILVGTRTYGKGTVQSVMPLKDGEAMKFTSAYYLTPLGTNIDQVGLEPDSVVENEYIPFDYSGYGNFDYAAVYEQGMSDPNIAKAKSILAVWDSFLGDTNDTYFGADLADAIQRFQALHGLFPYGVLDLTTQRELYKALTETKEVVDEQLNTAMRHYGITPIENQTANE